jgi:tRNA G10  N-methylase Trm11
MTLIGKGSLEKLGALAENSVDLFASDFPYGISMMNSRWDIDVPSEAILSECLRVIKPRHWLITTMSPRQDVSCECLMRLKNVGFEISYSSLEWVYNSGMPKAQNVYKALDKQSYNLWLKSYPVYFPYLYENLSKLKNRKLGYF